MFTHLNMNPSLLMSSLNTLHRCHSLTSLTHSLAYSLTHSLDPLLRSLAHCPLNSLARSLIRSIYPSLTNSLDSLDPILHSLTDSLTRCLNSLTLSSIHPHPTLSPIHPCTVKDVVNKLVSTSGITPEESASIKLLNNGSALERGDKLLPLFRGPELTLTMTTTLEVGTASRVFGECVIA